MKLTLTLILACVSVALVWGQSSDLLEIDPNLQDSLGYHNNIITQNFTPKNPAKAAILSSLFPGAGQFYADRSSVTAYIFPIIEVALIAAYIHYEQEGDDKTKEYERFVDTHYSRARQYAVEADLMDVIPANPSEEWIAANPEWSAQGEFDDIYNETHFRLDERNTQHFYEDVGKYNRYIFGWEDWFARYVVCDQNVNSWDSENNVWKPGADGQYAVSEVDWAFDVGYTNYQHHWTGNLFNNSLHPDWQANSIDAPYSALRSRYHSMRWDAEDSYDMGRYMLWGLIVNHIAASLDAVRVTKKHNLQSLSTNQYGWQLNVASINQNITPMFQLKRRF